MHHGTVLRSLLLPTISSLYTPFFCPLTVLLKLPLLHGSPTLNLYSFNPSPPSPALSLLLSAFLYSIIAFHFTLLTTYRHSRPSLALSQAFPTLFCSLSLPYPHLPYLHFLTHFLYLLAVFYPILILLQFFSHLLNPHMVLVVCFVPLSPFFTFFVLPLTSSSPPLPLSYSIAFLLSFLSPSAVFL